MALPGAEHQAEEVPLATAVCMSAHSVAVMALIEHKKTSEAVSCVESGSASNLCTPSTCSLVKVLVESPPPDSWPSLSV